MAGLINDTVGAVNYTTVATSSTTKLSSTTEKFISTTTMHHTPFWMPTKPFYEPPPTEVWWWPGRMVTSSPVLPLIYPGIWPITLGNPTWQAFQVVHTLMTVISLGINCAALVVVYGIVPRLTPQLQLLTSLAFADMLAPWAIMTMYFPASSCQDEIHSALLLTSHNAASLSLLALALAHNVSVFRPLQYERIVSQKRLWIVINVVWISSILSAHIHFLAVLTHHQPGRPFCVQVLLNTDIAVTLSAAITSATLLVTTLIYTRIYLHLRPIRLALNAEAAAAESRKSTRHVVTGIIITCTFMFTWIPYLATKYIQVRLSHWAHYPTLFILSLVQVFILLNAASNPLVYSLRMTCMQTGYLSLYHKFRNWVATKWRSISKYQENEELPSTPLNPIESIC